MNCFKMNKIGNQCFMHKESAGLTAMAIYLANFFWRIFFWPNFYEDSREANLSATIINFDMNSFMTIFLYHLESS